MNEYPRLLGDRYEVGDLVLGRGGTAEVRLGHDRVRAEAVAIKLLRMDLVGDPAFEELLRQEGELARRFDHPSVVRTLDAGEEPGEEGALPYVVMPYVEGPTLRDLLDGDGPLGPDAALEVTAGVLAALEYVHGLGLVHRDLKPADVVLTPEDGVRLLDFGVARDARSTAPEGRRVIGTADYLAPEQARGEPADARSDLYSLGCVLFELLTGRPPFTAEDDPIAVAYQHVHDDPPVPSSLRPDVPGHVDRIVARALAKRPGDRYRNAMGFRVDVAAARPDELARWVGIGE